MINRKIEETILSMLKIFRIVAINGPRQSGKTTLQKEIAKKLNMQYYTFDQAKTYDIASANPEDFIEYISEDKNVAIDEVQMIPEIVPAIKMSADELNRKGMFLLTGSSDMFKNSKIKESLAGRMVSFNLFPLSYAEINNKNINIIDKLFSDDFYKFNTDFSVIPREDLINAVVNGGYPEVYQLGSKERGFWFDFYIKARITKDIANFENVHLDKISQLDKLLKILATQTSSLVNFSNIAKNMGNIDAKTVQKYIQILEALYIIKLVPAYSNNGLKRVVKTPKVHFIDTGLVSHLLNINAKNLLEKKSEYIGNLVECFVYTELIKHQSYAQIDTQIYHFRDPYQKEVDFVLESKEGDILALEIKSGSTIKKEHFNGLIALAKTMKNRNFKGVILYGGNEILPYSIDEFRFWLIPLKIFI
ncbi:MULTISPECIES: ATP-binding protein [Pasteurellaceae]|uniref:ATP-binding protein n=1 Tax=Pasteurella atlantica TaxID=2827233 RepID=A0AAW8CGJ4_9PAST|nr:ATP-binding protein [Pasteurella atlantica]MBR0574659.1 ATP-binding protein [Pasteurella atlantica]MDP8039221.1 ATP-binding protein [Pasteurella atlantica]MDP8041312.1 ATP-binding protein [Pasteurella atlantica]MDP8043448.1 ATP-binding protein [Pasteurella atlantica]MDP8045633.1 ATP-binding protein [Pasteurella atlantica]